MSASDISLSPNSSIHGWLDGVLSLTGIKRGSEAAALEPPSKRKRRHPLHDVSNNIAPRMSSSPFKGAKREAVPATLMTNRRSARVPGKRRDKHEDRRDPDATPKPISLQPPPSLPPRSNSEYGSNASRSGSPTKMAGLTTVRGGIDYEMISIDTVLEDVQHALYDAREILEMLDNFSFGLGILPASMQEQLQADYRYRREFSKPGIFDNSRRRDQLGHTPCIDRVVDIFEGTDECRVDQEHEAAWNCCVHWPMANLAEKTSCHTEKLKLKNITVAKIQPAHLAPQFANGPKLQLKMVDFAYVLDPTPAMKAAYGNLDHPTDAPYPSFNHTCHSTILKRPIAISLETKPGTVAGDDALPQLAIWAHAHFQKLAELTAAARHQSAAPTAMPLLFLIVVQGEKWSFCVASKATGGPMTLWRPRNDVSTATKLGVYQVLASLHVVLEWAATKYLPWFEQNALPLTSEEKEALQGS